MITTPGEQQEWCALTLRGIRRAALELGAWVDTVEQAAAGDSRVMPRETDAGAMAAALMGAGGNTPVENRGLLAV